MSVFVIAHTDRNEFVANLGEENSRLNGWIVAERREGEYCGTLHNGHKIFVTPHFDNIQSQADLDDWKRRNPPQDCNYVGQPA